MRKFMGVAAALLLLTAGSAAGQTSGTGTVTASARVLATLTVDAEQGLAFGELAPGASADVPLAASGVGYVQVGHNSEFSTSAVVPVELTRQFAGVADPTATMPVTFKCGYSASNNGALIGGEQSCGAMGNRAIAPSGTSQSTFVQVGGSLSVPADAKPGTYTGDIVFTFTATNY